MKTWLNKFVVALLAGFFLVQLSGCGTVDRPEIRSVRDAIGVTSKDVKSVADQVEESCAASVQGGPCAPGALIDTGTRDRMAMALLHVQEDLERARRFERVYEDTKAQGLLRRIDAVLLLITDELTTQGESP